MLRHTLRWVLTYTGIGLSLLLNAQIEVTGPIRSTGSAGQRGVAGTAEPLTDDAAITLSVAASGQLHWASATLVGDTLELGSQPPVSSYRNGQLLRFVSTASNTGATWLRADGLAAMPLVRTDGLPLAYGTLRVGSMFEVIFANNSWILVIAPKDACPPGSLPLGTYACIDAEAVAGLGYYAAMDHCSDKGGKLCTWDEYFLGCTLLGAQMSGLFDEWEWIDDSANHTHTANQVGRSTCMSERSTNGIPIFTGDARCCYHPR